MTGLKQLRGYAWKKDPFQLPPATTLHSPTTLGKLREEAGQTIDEAEEFTQRASLGSKLMNKVT